ncbi:hypothetical protein ACS0TY_011818 [Phlomoides rotata]
MIQVIQLHIILIVINSVYRDPVVICKKLYHLCRNSLPLILFSLLLGFGGFLFGRAKGRQEAYTNVQVFGALAPPPRSVATANPLQVRQFC